LRLARRRAAGPRVWAVEGTGSYGKGLTRYLTGQAEQVLEVEGSARISVYPTGLSGGVVTIAA